MPVEHAAADAAGIENRDREHFDRIAEKYGRKDAIPSARIAREYQVLRCVAPVLADQGRIGTIVEVGCGIGRAAKYLRGRYEKYIGIDQSIRLIEAARAFNSDCAAEFICANVKSVSLPSGVGDLVVLIGALHHMTELPSVVAALRRIARPGASLVALEPNRGNPMIMGLRRIRQRLDSTYSEDQLYFSRGELSSLLQREGLFSVQVDYEGYVSPPFAEVPLRPQWLSAPLGRLAVAVDAALDTHMPRPLRVLSWNLIARARFSS